MDNLGYDSEKGILIFDTVGGRDGTINKIEWRVFE